MHYKRLGNTGLLTSDLTLGTMLYGEGQARSTPADVAERQIHYFLDQGGNHIDTADVYAHGRSEEIVGKAIQGKRSEVILATKVRFPRGEGKNEAGLSRHHIMEGLEASLRRLKTDYIDLYYLHCWDPLTRPEEFMRCLDDLVRSGKVRYLGVSNFKAWQVMKSLSVSDLGGYVRFVAGQYQYSLVKRDIEYEFLDFFPSEGIGLMPWGPLGGGFLSGKYRPEQKPKNASEGRIASTAEETEESWARRNTEQNWKVLEAVETVAKKHQVSFAQVALAWLRLQPWVSSVIIGARTMEQLEDNLKAAQLKLTVKEMQQLSKVSAPPELYPYRMIEAYGSRSEG